VSTILVVGAGLMGPAAAFDAMGAPEITAVGLCDASAAQLAAAGEALARHPGAGKLRPVRLDLDDQAATVRLMAAHDAVVVAASTVALPLALRAVLAARRPAVTLGSPDPATLPGLRRDADAGPTLIVPGCGVEPGLTEILTRHLAEQLDRVDEVHIKCGGIPERPTPPLGYKIVFGGRALPLRESDAPVVEAGRLTSVPRYSGVEPVSFPGVGACEAWHEGFRTSLLELPALRSLRTGTQKTVRWPGYAAKVTVLKELGLLGQTPVEVDGVPVVPKRLVDAVLYPHVRLEPGERDLTVLRVEVLGEAGGRPARRAAEMVDRFDVRTGLTSMARTTSFTASSVARMLARGELTGTGVQHPEQLVAGPRFDRLLADLAAHGVRIDFAEGAAPGS
jgi:lysine 6-dehydrogenase